MPDSRLAHLPVSFFSAVMGLCGFALALGRAREILGTPAWPVTLVAGMAAVLFVVLAGLYFTKWRRYPEQVAKELAHPVKLSFFPTLSISLILLGIVALNFSRIASLLLWGAGTLLHLFFTLFVLSRWMTHTHFEIQHSNPSWFIPIVGNILIPIGGMAHGFREISWFFFSIGLVYWLVLLSILFNRIIFHAPLPEKLLPTLFILLAPPSVGFISYLSLTGGVDAFARILYYSALFLMLLLAFQYRHFTRIRFYLSWWAYSFPLAAFTVASLLMATYTRYRFFTGLSWGMLVLLTAVMGVLIVRTLQAVRRGEICVEE